MAIPLRVLIVEDSEDDMLLLLRELRRGGYDPTYERVDTRDAMRAALDRQAWDAILCDYSMPHLSAPEALSLLQGTGLDLPFIIVSGTIGEDTAVAAMKAGAHDYLLKGNLTRLAPAVERELREVKERAARRHAEDALRETAETLRAIIESSPLAIIALEPEGTVQLWNSAAERIFGWRAAEVLGGPLPLVPADRQEESQALRQRVLQGEAISEVEIRRQRKDGSPIDVSLSTAPLHDTHGRVTGIVGIVADISERLRAEQRLRLQGAALEAAANAIVITDREGRITWVNPAFTRLTGYTPEEILGENPRLLRSDKQDRAFYEHLWNTILSGQVWRGEIVNRRKDGSLYTEEMTVTPVHDEGGEISHFIAIKHDITERKRAEAALWAKDEEIRTMTQQLWQAAKLATMGELAASIAHELNNPLATVSLRVEALLGQAPEGSAQHQALEIIEQEVERMGSLVTSLLSFSRRSQRRVSSLDVREEIEKTLELIHYHLRNHRVTLVREFAPAVPLIQADRQQMQQLFLNLFTNATDAMPEGGTLTIRVGVGEYGSMGEGTAPTRSTPPHLHTPTQVIIEVADTGVGIAPVDLPKVMEPFFTTKPEGKGTGLGLGICRRIVQEHGGTLEITSEPGRGTTVRVVLPVGDSSNSAHLREE